MATILIVEDEFLIADEIARTLVRLNHTPLDPVDNGDKALEVLSQQAVELVLMDINIAGDTDGIATALLVRRQFAVPVVFLTARSDAATISRAKLAQPYGYLVKPFTDDSLRAQIEIALYNAYQAPPPRPAAVETPAASDTSSFTSLALFVRKGTGHVKVPFDSILYAEALQNYVRLHTAEGNYVFDSSLKELEPKLPCNFFRTHRSHVVNLNHVSAYEDGYVLLGGDHLPVPVSRSCKEELKSRLPLVG